MISPLLDPSLQGALRDLEPGMDPLEAVERLRRTLDPVQARAAAELHALRGRAQGRFDQPGRLLLTRRGLEQASDRRVAGARARRIAAHLAQRTGWVLDATAGLGGDTLALGAAGVRLVAADADPLVVQLLRANVAAMGSAARVIRARAEEPAVRADVLVLDPDRRAADGQRIGDPAGWSPSWTRCADLLASHPAGCAKVAPALDVERLARSLPSQLTWSAQWVSLAGELKEVCLWTGELARPAGSREVLRLSRTGAEETWSASPAHTQALEPSESRRVAWIAEPDPTVIRAGLVGALARETGLSPLAPEIAYLGGERPPTSPFLRVFRVLGSAPVDPRHVRALLSEHDVGELIVKKRGHPEDADTLARKLRGRGQLRGLLIVTRLEDGHQAFLVEERRSGPDTEVSSPR